MRNGKLISMVKNSFALALGSWQTAVLKYFHFSAHQNMFANVVGNATGYCLVILSFIARPPFHLEGQVITSVRPSFHMNLVLAANFRNL